MLRVFLPAAPRTDRADRWIRVGTEGRAIDRGQDVPSRWPADAAIDAVLAADQVRLIALTLPPMPPERLRGAVRYALEDQVATPLDESAIAVAAPRDGTCLVAVASAALIRAAAAHERRFARIVPEAALAPTRAGWTWCASGAGGGFVRRHDGSAFAVQRVSAAQASLPAELAAALAQSQRAKTPPATVHVAFAVDDAQLATWTQAGGVAFARAPAWQWEDADAAALAAAPDFLREAARREERATSSSTWRLFRPALVVAAIAVVIHLAGLVAQWSWLSFSHWRLSQALVDTAKAAQLANAESPDAALQAIARQYALARHRAQQAAPADALPLLARAAPALGSLPPGALRAARYAGDAWTLELGKVDPSLVPGLARRLADAGVDALAAPTSGGTRVRLSLAPTAR